MDVYEALAARRSVRGFLPREVPEEVLTRVFEAAQRAPSWCNIQPWRVVVTRGTSTRRFAERMLEAARAGRTSTDFAWPTEYPEPYGRHRKECGKALYEAMGVARDDYAARQAAWLRNFEAFGAPHMALVGVDRRMMPYAGIDLGCWLQSVMLACVHEGLGTCAQAALAAHADAVRDLLGWEPEVGLIFGVAIGYEDPAVPANRCHTSRGALPENVRFV
jgi:nitroreductase